MASSCGLASFKDEKGAENQGDNRLYRILVSEAAYLIWKLRCERVIGNDDDPDEWPSTAEIENRWYATMNLRLLLDKAATRKDLSKNHLEKSTVISTWTKVLHNEDNLPRNWLRKSGVLVGRVPKDESHTGPH